MSYIYKITNNINGKNYIGQTSTTIKNRWKQHIQDSKKYCNRPLYKAFLKYGINSFSIEIIEECSEKEVNERERFWINYYNSYHYGYNATLGGEGSLKYNYKEIANKYLELKNQKETAIFFHCDESVVKNALDALNITRFKINHSEKLKKRVLMLDKETEKPLKIFSSLREAAKDITGSTDGNSHIGQVCRGKRKSAYGYKWKFV